MTRAWAAGLLLWAAAGCSDGAAPSSSSSPAAPASSMGASSAVPGGGEGLRYEVPSAWISEPPSNRLRKAQYRVPDKAGQAAEAELVVSSFRGPRIPLADNMRRWSAQMGGAEGRAEKIEAALEVTLVDYSGTYAGDAATDPIPEARMLMGIVETEEAPWYFKLVGPAPTVSAWREDFVRLLQGVRPE